MLEELYDSSFDPAVLEGWGPPGCEDAPGTPPAPEGGKVPLRPMDAPLYKSDAFRINCFKVLACPKRATHDWRTCPFTHPGERGRRRSLSAYTYDATMCPAARRGERCPNGDACPKSHNVFEQWLHPDRYRTLMCGRGMDCRRRLCFFAHSAAELRTGAAPLAAAPALPPGPDAPLRGAPRAGRGASAPSTPPAATPAGRTCPSAPRSPRRRPAAAIMLARPASTGGGGGAWSAGGAGACSPVTPPLSAGGAAGGGGASPLAGATHISAPFDTPPLLPAPWGGPLAPAAAAGGGPAAPQGGGGAALLHELIAHASAASAAAAAAGAAARDAEGRALAYMAQLRAAAAESAAPPPQQQQPLLQGGPYVPRADCGAGLLAGGAAGSGGSCGGGLAEGPLFACAEPGAPAPAPFGWGGFGAAAGAWPTADGGGGGAAAGPHAWAPQAALWPAHFSDPGYACPMAMLSGGAAPTLAPAAGCWAPAAF
ncbi:MAG: hypothetical protein J3K34DRAFT_508444 [Monoraphidium minutum]|nr:MAG: hypothetical protein J3K34DRAFT_508444 [Monoraphidium minutum]